MLAGKIPQQAVWQGASTRLDAALMPLGFARSRSHAAALIRSQKILINQQTVKKPGHKIVPGDTITNTAPDPYVSRGAYKLLAAITEFQIPVAGKIALDLGASTGGFTQVLLENQAQHVIALDVGHSQLSEQLRLDAQITVVENFNARNLSPAALKAAAKTIEMPELIVGDLSFISLQLIFPAIAAIASANTEVCLLIKPQYEVGNLNLKTAAAQQHALQQVITAAHENGFEALNLMRSPITGSNGTREYLGYWRYNTQADPPQLKDKIAALSEER